MALKVIATRGSLYLLLMLGPDGRPTLNDWGAEMVRVLDDSKNILHAPGNIESVLARGYWEPFVGDQDKILARLPK